MPQKEDKWKAFFADLGRPTLRGIRKCPKCGTVNGTRGNVCKNKNCDVIFRGNGNRKKVSLETCQIYTSPKCQKKLYSVRVRDRGPDYRTFVQVSGSDGESESGDITQSKCFLDTCAAIDQQATPCTHVLATKKCFSRSESEDKAQSKCFLDTCAAIDQQTTPCIHVLATKKCFSRSEEIVVKPTVLSSISIPDEYYATLSHLINDYPQLMVQRVSKCSFVVKCQKSDRHPLGYLHIMFMKTVKDDTITYKKFLCNCRPFKVPPRDPESMQSDSSGNFAFKLCLHFYACLCAFASEPSLANEFEHLLSSATHEVSQPLLSQLQLVTLPHHSNTDKTGESMDPNQISVEIMRENISLLESIVAGDESTLANVQGLEGVLADQIIVTNVDDSLSFGDGAVLDSLEETDQQVCQILGQNTIHLTTYTASQSDQLHNLDITNTNGQNQDEQDCNIEHNSGRKRKELHVSFPESSKTHNVVISQLPVIPTPMKSSNFQNTSSANNTGVCSSESNSSVEKSPNLTSFDNWLAGVNDRINATMNYQLPTTPEPLIYYVPNDYFEILKERISSGGKKRRLPNHTVVFHRTDKAPLGTFTKHTWKITNILQVLHIFNCSLVQLKAKQFFVKTNAGNFVEWIPPKNEDEKNQRILPVLHSTFLKCGRNHGAGCKDSIPFTIEWIPDIFTKSKLGELTIGFQFGKTGPIHENEEDARVNVFRIPKSY